MNRFFSIVITVFFMLSAVVAGAQISGVVNTYAAVSAVNTTNHEVTVASAAGFSVGDRVMLIQMTGATIDETNTANFGEISDLGETGNYEIQEICGISGTTISFLNEIEKAYDPSAGAVQLVRIATYTNVSVTGPVVATPWNGTTGGVIAIEVSGTLTLNSNIDATGAGFAGGVPNTALNSVCDVSTFFLPNTSTTGGGKGAGIAAFIAGKENARGKQANGGGGGNSFNSGGAGGSNSGSGGGGSFGYDGGICNGDMVGGIAGLDLGYGNAFNRVFMGGGGGAGHANSNDATDGGNGGGIVYVVANELNGNNQTIRANGASAADATAASADGAGGGGAGGVILLDVKIFTNIVTLETNGGDGGDNQNTTECVGPGGGGGGGTIWTTSLLPASVITSNNGGVAGSKIGGPGSCAGTNYGATDGLPGQQLTGLIVPVGLSPDAGDDGILLLCSTENNADLDAGLTGTPDAGGTWLDDDATGALTANIFDATSVAAGNYDFTYVVASGTCATDSATVTVTVSTDPDAGGNGVITVCSDNGTVDLFSQLSGTPDLTGVWNDDDATGALSAGIFDPSQVAAGTFDFTYVVAGSSPCVNDSATVSVTVAVAANAGSDVAVASCSSVTSLDLFNLLGSADAGGTWTDNQGSGALTGNIFDPSAAGNGIWTFTYVVTGVGPCANDTADVTVNVTGSVNPGSNTVVNICQNETAYDLFANMGGSPDPGGTWNDDDNTGNLNGAFFDAASGIPGTYDFTYTIAPLGGCTSGSATLTVLVNQFLDAGDDSNFATCDNAATVDLMTALAGSPVNGGVWTDDDASGALSGSNFDPSVAGAGVWNFTYQQMGAGPCPNDTATVTVSVTPAPNAGNSTTVSICSSETALDLFSQLGGTPDLGGTWTDDNNSGGLNGSVLNASGLSSGGTYNFTYTVLGIGACANATATVSVNITPAPNAGTSGVISACDASTNIDLFTGLGGAPDLGGTWFDTDGSGALSGNLFDANSAGIGGWLFTYVVTGNSPCVNDTSTVAVIVIQAQSAGNDSILDVCGTDATFNLFSGLSGQTSSNGTWLDDDATGQLNNGFFNTTNVTPGTSYDFTYILPAAGCPTDSATITVNVQTPPDAGTGDSLIVCQSGTLDLTTGLLGTPDAGGTWNDDDATGQLTGSTLNVASLPLGTYHFTYQVMGASPCVPVSTTVTVIVTTAPDAGTNGSVGGCTTGPVVDLFTGLGGSPDMYGTWTDNSGSGQLSGNIFDPAGLAPGIYQFSYSVSAIGCATATSNVTVAVIAGPNAGVDSTGLTCPATTTFDLFTALGGSFDAGGAWLDDDNTGALSANIFNPAVVPAGTYNFTYVVAGGGACANDSATVAVTVGPGSNAGTGNTVFACNLDTAYSLFNGLSGTYDLNGVWNDNDNTGALTGSVFNAGAVPTGVYTFTYVVSYCGIDSAVVTVDVTAGNDAGSNASVAVCANDNAYDLLTGLAGTPDPGGTWTDNDNSGALSGSILDASQPPLGIYQFTYSFPASGVCPANSSLLTVVIVQGTDAGNDATVTTCSSDTALDLFASLNGAPDTGGNWLDDDVTGGLNGATYDASIAGGGSYNFTYVVSGCADDSATVTVNVIQAASAGTDTTIQICDQNTSFDLFGALGGTPDAGGVWNDNNATGALTGSVFNASQAGQGTYTFAYLVLGTAPCTNATSTITVQVTGAPNAGVGDTLVACDADVLLDLSTGFSTAGDNFGTYLDDDNTGAITGSNFNPSVAGAGTYQVTYEVTANGCTADNTIIIVEVHPQPDAGTGDTLTYCSSDGPLMLFDLLGGTPVTGGNWVDNSSAGTLSGDTLDISTLDGSYLFTYSVPGVGNCSSDFSQLRIFVIEQPYAGIGDTIETCQDVVSLFEGLNGSNISQSGSWTDLDGSGALIGSFFNPDNASEGTWHFQYDVGGQGVCPSDQSEVVVIFDCIDDIPPIPEGFSPNGDGVNEAFAIEGLEQFPDAKIQIFNRWGKQVFAADPYLNDWRGEWQTGGDAGKPLPEGTYFYILELREDLDPVQGYVFIKR